MLGLRFCARAFSSCGERGPLFIAVLGPLTVAASPVAEHRLQTAQAQWLWRTGPVAPRHVGSSQTRARTCVPCIGRRILNHYATREAPRVSYSWCPLAAAVCVIFVASGCSAPDPRDTAEEGWTKVVRVVQRMQGWSVWSGHPRWLFSCSLSIPCSKTLLQTCKLPHPLNHSLVLKLGKHGGVQPNTSTLTIYLPAGGWGVDIFTFSQYCYPGNAHRFLFCVTIWVSVKTKQNHKVFPKYGKLLKWSWVIRVHGGFFSTASLVTADGVKLRWLDLISCSLP